MRLLPRKLSAGEVPGHNWCNQLLEFVRSTAPRGSATVRTEETGAGTILHAPARGAAASARFPGLVFANGHRFYDPDLVADPAEQYGTPMADNSTGGTKPWIRVAVSAATITDVASISVAYEDAPASPASPWPAGEYWFETRRWTVPVTVNIPTGADAEGQVLMFDGTHYKWQEVVVAARLPAGGLAGQMLVASNDLPESLEDEMEWADVPAGLPAGSLGDLLQNNGGGDTDPVRGWRVLSGTGAHEIPYRDETSGMFTLLAPSSTYPALFCFDPATDPAWKLAEPPSNVPAVPVWQPGAAALVFVPVDAPFKGIWRDESGNLVADYARAF